MEQKLVIIINLGGVKIICTILQLWLRRQKCSYRDLGHTRFYPGQCNHFRPLEFVSSVIRQNGNPICSYLARIKPQLWKPIKFALIWRVLCQPNERSKKNEINKTRKQRDKEKGDETQILKWYLLYVNRPDCV